MKYLYHLLFVVFLFQACTIAPKESESEIEKVENNLLIHPIYMAGDSTRSIEERMAHYGVPGVSIAVIKDNKIIWAKSYGVMDKESKQPVTNETLFQAGSISKPVASYGALKVVESGKINLDENVNTYLKSWRLPDNEFTKDKKVAIKHLLSHTGGLTVHGFPGYSPDLPMPTLIQVLNGEAPANTSSIFVDKVPEESFRYSGGGYTVMQQMLIDVEGKPFPPLLNELVLTPLDMKHSTYDQPLNETQLKMAATGYLPDGSMTKGKRHTYPEMAAAGLWTTAEDLALFAIDIQKTVKGESAKVVSQNMANKMLTPFVEDFIGLGIFLDKHKEDIYFGHGGWDEGFSSELVAHRDKGYGVVILTNSNHPDFISELIRSVAYTYAWDNYIPQYKKLEMDTSLFSQITGRYYSSSDGLIKVYRENGRLYRKYLRGNPLELFRISDTTFISHEEDQVIQFKTNPVDGKFNIVLYENCKGEFKHPMLSEAEKVPYEFLLIGDFDHALAGYKNLLAADPKDNSINEGNLNQQGYNLLRQKKIKLSLDVFKINMLLYPNSANVYDSYAEACMENGDKELAIVNYKKSLSLNPENKQAAKMLEELQSKK